MKGCMHLKHCQCRSDELVSRLSAFPLLPSLPTACCPLICPPAPLIPWLQAYLINEQHTRHDLGLALLAPLRHLHVDLLSHLVPDLARVSGEQRQKALGVCAGEVGQCSVIPQSDGEQLKKGSGIRAAVGQGKEYSLLMTKRAPHPTTPAPLQPFLRAPWPPPACALICAQHLLTSHPA